MLQNKDAGYVENQQQNIADAIDLLPRLATGIDVNIKFRRLNWLYDKYSSFSLNLYAFIGLEQSISFNCRIDDFEFTRECAIFDLLDIPLYHGWIVDPQVPYHFGLCAFVPMLITYLGVNSQVTCDVCFI